MSSRARTSPLEPFPYRDHRRYVQDWRTLRALDGLPESLGWLAVRLALNPRTVRNILARGDAPPEGYAGTLTRTLGLLGEAADFFPHLIAFNTASALMVRQQALEAAVAVLVARAERLGQGPVLRARLGWPHVGVRAWLQRGVSDPVDLAVRLGTTPEEVVVALADLAVPQAARAVPTRLTLGPDSDLVDVLAMDRALRRAQDRLRVAPEGVYRRMGFWALPRTMGADAATVDRLRPGFDGAGPPAELITGVLPAGLPLGQPVPRVPSSLQEP